MTDHHMHHQRKNGSWSYKETHRSPQIITQTAAQSRAARVLALAGTAKLTPAQLVQRLQNEITRKAVSKDPIRMAYLLDLTPTDCLKLDTNPAFIDAVQHLAYYVRLQVTEAASAHYGSSWRKGEKL